MRALLIAAVALAACGTPSPQMMDEPKLRVVSDAPTQGAALTSDETAAAGTISAVGSSQAGDLVMVAADRVFERTAGVITERNLYAEGSDPTSLGMVSAIIPRAVGGAWLGAENGLFELEGDYVTHSPVMVGMGPLSGASEVGEGNLSGLWLAATNGVYRRQPDQTYRYQIDGYDTVATGIAGDPSGAGAFAILGGKLVLLTPGDGTTPTAADPPDDVGAVHAVAAAKNTLWAATERGLYRWQLSATPQWTRFALGDVAALDVRVDPVTASAWVVTADNLMRVDVDAVTSYARPDGTALLAIDRLGDLWTAKAATLVRIAAGVGTTDAKYSTDIKPWITTNCAMCHSDFTDVIGFSPHAEEALQRVRIGDMPRCMGGVPCASDQHLKPEDYAVLESWIRGGKQP